MDTGQFSDWVYRELFKAGMNIDYHQVMAWRWDVSNRALIILAIVFGAICAFLSANKKAADKSFRWSIVSFAFLAVCLVIPAGQHASQYELLAQRWGDIKSDIESLQLAAQGNHEKPLSEAAIAAEREAIIRKISALEQTEPAPYQGLLIACWGRQAERIHGKGINTPEKVREHVEEVNRPISKSPG